MERFAKQGALWLLCRQLRRQRLGRHRGPDALADVWRPQRQELGQTTLYQYAIPLHLYERLLRHGFAPERIYLQRTDEEPRRLLPPLLHITRRLAAEKDLHPLQRRRSWLLCMGERTVRWLCRGLLSAQRL